MEYFTFQLSWFLNLQYETIVRTGATREHCFPFDVWETKPENYLKRMLHETARQAQDCYIVLSIRHSRDEEFFSSAAWRWFLFDHLSED